MESRPIKKSLKLRLQLLVCLSILPSVILMVLSARERREMDAHKVQQEALRLVIFAASNLQRDVQGGRAYLTALAQDLHWPREEEKTCSEDMRVLQDRSRLYSTIGIADSTGRIVCHSNQTSSLSSVGQTTWFKEVMQGLGFSVGYDGDRILSEKATMNFALPLKTSEGRTLVLFCALDLDWLNHLAQRVQLPQNSTLTVLGSRDQVLVRYPDPERWVGNRIQVDPLAASLSLNKEGVAEAPGLDGVQRLYAFTEIPEGRLSLRLGIPSEQAYAAADSAMLANLTWLAAGALLAILAAWAAGHWMFVRPVDKLVVATRKLATGNLAARTDVDYADGELGQLARAFDEMAESLEWREAQLRESEQERVQSEGRFTEMVELAADAIIGVDAKFSIFFFNRRAQSIFGYEPEEVEGRDLQMLEPSAEYPSNGHSELVAALREHGKARIEVMVRSKNGTVFPAEASFSCAQRDGITSYTLILREKKEASVQPGIRA